MLLLAMEVDSYFETIQGKKCFLCPFRAFDRTSRLKAHKARHCAKNKYVADGRSHQLAVVRAMYDQQLIIAPLVPFLASSTSFLARSALLIAKQNSACSAYTLDGLQRNNRPFLFRVLSKNGPEYQAPELTTNCVRHSRELYYTSAFADLFLSILLTNEGRILTSIDALHTFFGTKTDVCGLLPSYSVVWKEIAGDLVNSNIFCSKLKELQYKNAAAGEYTVVTHDETFKTLFALIGQKKMSQSPGELHALHIFRGFTGCTLGISTQRSTSTLCFETAVRDIFDNFVLQSAIYFFGHPFSNNNWGSSLFQLADCSW